MLSIAYASSATAHMTEDDVASILLQSRANNRRDGLTGALMYRAERFVQILEGPDEIVRERFGIISADPRHSHVNVIRELQLVQRQFPQWTMGFHEADSSIGAQLPGYENILERRGAERIKHADNAGQQFLEWLGEYWLPRRA